MNIECSLHVSDVEFLLENLQTYLVVYPVLRAKIRFNIWHLILNEPNVT